jgi:hypothetical protein
MNDRNSQIDAELQREVDRLRGQGFEVCAIVSTNREGDARLLTTLDSDADVVSLLTFLLSKFPESEKVSGSAAH